MNNGQLKPAYNLQLSTGNQYIVNYSIHHNPTDTTTLPSHIEGHQQLYKEVPEVVVADAGYGSEQNYQYLEDQGIRAYVKHNHFDKDRKSGASAGRKNKPADKHPFHIDKLYYNPDKDCYICPMGQPMHHVGQRTITTQAGFKRVLSVYQAGNCAGCPLRGVCYKAKGNRTVEVSHEGQLLKQQATKRLCSDQGIAYRKLVATITDYTRVTDQQAPIFLNSKNHLNNYF